MSDEDQEETPFDKSARRIVERGQEYAVGYLSALLEQQHELIQQINEHHQKDPAHD